MRQSILHPEVVLLLPKPHLKYADKAQAMITAVDGNANFPNAATQVAAAKAALKPYLDAIAARARREAGAVKARNDARRMLQQAMGHLRDAIQSAVDADVEQAESLAASAKMGIRKVPVRTKDPFEARDGNVSGQVLLIAKAIPGALTYYWEVSTDSKTWSALPETSRANTAAGGLTPGQTYYFRFRAHTRKNGMTDWLTTSILVR